MRALVTGGSRGIGKAIIKRFEKESIEVFNPTRKELDLNNYDSIEEFTSRFNTQIDILINNAGINEIDKFENLTDVQIASILNVNLISIIKLTRNLLPLLQQSNYPRIVNISSIWGTVSKEGRSIYSVSKAGLNALTRSLAIEFARIPILINSVAPGYVDTELTKANNTKEQLRRIKKLIPLGRLAEPNEISELVYFLSSPKNTYITGQVIFIDGGYTCL
ncbi:MAG: SDR family oxidoreductase [Elusimicrobiota bacterium]